MSIKFTAFLCIIANFSTKMRPMFGFYCQYMQYLRVFGYVFAILANLLLPTMFEF